MEMITIVTFHKESTAIGDNNNTQQQCLTWLNAFQRSVKGVF